MCGLLCRHTSPVSALPCSGHTSEPLLLPFLPPDSPVPSSPKTNLHSSSKALLTCSSLVACRVLGALCFVRPLPRASRAITRVHVCCPLGLTLREKRRGICGGAPTVAMYFPCVVRHDLHATPHHRCVSRCIGVRVSLGIQIALESHSALHFLTVQPWAEPL